MIHKIKQQIPNSLTLLNLLCGCLAIFCLFASKIDYIFILIGISLVADFLDGLVARALNVKSAIGGDLDSLADMVSFGVLPGFIMVHLASSIEFSLDSFNLEGNSLPNILTNSLLFFPLIITLFSALRLAIFNNSSNQTHDFMGLATPAATLFVLGLLYNFHHNEYNLLSKVWHLDVLSVVLAFLLVSKIKMFSFKLTSSILKDNLHLVIFAIGIILLLLVFKLAAIPFIMLWYIVINLAKNLMVK